jgi:hypothetical protein
MERNLRTCGSEAELHPSARHYRYILASTKGDLVLKEQRFGLVTEEVWACGLFVEVRRQIVPVVTRHEPVAMMDTCVSA